jgi:hypothetical protein
MKKHHHRHHGWGQHTAHATRFRRALRGCCRAGFCRIAPRGENQRYRNQRANQTAGNHRGGHATECRNTQHEGGCNGATQKPASGVQRKGAAYSAFTNIRTKHCVIRGVIDAIGEPSHGDGHHQHGPAWKQPKQDKG